MGEKNKRTEYNRQMVNAQKIYHMYNWCTKMRGKNGAGKKILEQLMHELTPKLINIRLQSTDSRSSVDPKHSKPKTNKT